MESLDELKKSVGLEYLSSTPKETFQISDESATLQVLEPVSNGIVTIEQPNFQNDKML